MNLLQKDIQIERTYKPENNGMFDYMLIVKNDPCKEVHSANAYDFGIVNINPTDYSFHLEMYKNSESVPPTDYTDPNTFIIPVTIPCKELTQ